MAARLRYRFGDNEVELEGDQGFIDKYLSKFLMRLSGVPTVPARYETVELRTGQPAKTPNKKISSPAEFYREKAPNGGTETVLVIAKYLEDFRSVTEFSRGDVNKIAKETKIKDVHSQYFTSAVKQGLIRLVGQSKYSLTLSGEDIVAAMPKTSTPKS